MFPRPMKQTVLVGLLTSVFLLTGCFPPAVQPTPIAVEPTVTSAPPAPPVPTIAPTPMTMPSLGEPLSLGRGRIVDAAFLPDASAVVIGWAYGVSLAMVNGGGELWWQATDVPVIALDVQPQGEAVAAALGDGRVMILDAATGSPKLFEGAAPEAYWGDIAWSPDGQQIAFQFIGPLRSDPIFVLDVVSGLIREVPNSRIDEGVTPWLVWSPDGQALTLASLDQTCSRIIDAHTGETVFTLKSNDSCYPAYIFAWSPAGDLAAARGAPNTLELIEPHAGKTVRTFRSEALGFSWPYLSHYLIFSADSIWLANKGGNNYDGNTYPLIVWDVKTGKPLAQLGKQGNAYELGMNDRDRLVSVFDGSSLISLYENGEITRWAFGNKGTQEVLTGHVPVASVAYPTALIWSANGRKLAALNRYGGVAVWNVAADRREGQPDRLFDPPLSAPAFSPDARLIALTDREQQAEIVYDLATNQVIATLPDSTSLPQATAFSPNGTQIAYGFGNTVIVADLKSGARMTALTGYPDQQSIMLVKWSPDGEALVAASGDPAFDTALGTVILWERNAAGSFSEVFRTESVRTGYGTEPIALFNPAGQLVAFEQLPSLEAGQFKLHIFDRETRQVIWSLSEHELAEWISDEILLTSEAQGDTRMTQWDVRTDARIIGVGRELGDNVYAPGGLFYARPRTEAPNIMRAIEMREWHTGDVVAQGVYGSDIFRINWSPDGRWLAAQATDGTIKVWPVQW
jgi:WD40 repeat protein